MDEQLKVLLNQFAIEMLQKVKTGIDLASTFLGEELPKVAKEIIAWGLGKAIFYTSMLAVLAIISFVFSFVGHRAQIKKRGGQSWEWDYDGGAWAFIFCLVLGFIFLLASFSQASYIVKIAVAPRVYLIEQLIQMTKGVPQ